MFSTTIANLLLDIGAVRLSPTAPFRWSSGWLSPIYCDNRLTLSYPETRRFIKDAFVSLIKEKFASAEMIAGVATAGIPQGVLVAEALNLPFVYVRSEAKKHGMTNLIEGIVQKGQKIIVIEDLVSTGGSSLRAVDALREAGGDVLALISIMTYGFEVAFKAFKEKNIPFYALTSYETLILEAIRRKQISEDTRASLEKWREDPAHWTG